MVQRRSAPVHHREREMVAIVRTHQILALFNWFLKEVTLIRCLGTRVLIIIIGTWRLCLSGPIALISLNLALDL